MLQPPKTGKDKKRKLEDGKESADSPKPKLKASVSVSDSLTGTDFSLTATTASGQKPNFKIASWNINGIRAWLDVSHHIIVFKQCNVCITNKNNILHTCMISLCKDLIV